MKTTAPFAYRVVADVVDGWIAWAFGRLDQPDIPSLRVLGGELLLDGKIVVEDGADFDPSDSIHDPGAHARFEREVIASLNARGLPEPFYGDVDILGEFEERIRAIARKVLLPGD